MKIPPRLPPDLPEFLPYNLWIRELINGTAKHLLSWKHSGLRDDQVLILGFQMIEASCMHATLVHQEWLEVEYGSDRATAIQMLLTVAARQINLDLSKLPYTLAPGGQADTTTSTTNPMANIAPSSSITGRITS